MSSTSMSFNNLKFQLRSIFSAMPPVINEGINDPEEEGTRHFMVNVIEPQFNLHSEDANVSREELRP